MLFFLLGLLIFISLPAFLPPLKKVMLKSWVVFLLISLLFAGSAFLLVFIFVDRILLDPMLQLMVESNNAAEKIYAMHKAEIIQEAWLETMTFHLLRPCFSNLDVVCEYANSLYSSSLLIASLCGCLVFGGSALFYLLTCSPATLMKLESGRLSKGAERAIRARRAHKQINSEFHIQSK